MWIRVIYVDLRASRACACPRHAGRSGSAPLGAACASTLAYQPECLLRITEVRGHALIVVRTAENAALVVECGVVGLTAIASGRRTATRVGRIHATRFCRSWLAGVGRRREPRRRSPVSGCTTEMAIGAGDSGKAAARRGQCPSSESKRSDDSAEISSQPPISSRAAARTCSADIPRSRPSRAIVSRGS